MLHTHSAVNTTTVSSVSATGPPQLTEERIQQTYSKVLSCLQRRWNFPTNPKTNHPENISYAFPLPMERAQSHYEEVLLATEKYRRTPIHSYAGYSGPWIENQFITTFIDKPLSYFNGLIPLFVQWIDNHLLNKLKEIETELKKVLRKDVLYFVVSQGDNGLEHITYTFPNMLIFSCGGFGHAVLPLIKGELRWRELPRKFEQSVGFFGSVIAHRSKRAELLHRVEASCKRHRVSFRMDHGEGWLERMSATKFNLAPRGYGRSSFRFAESIQLGRLPVFMHQDLHWAPYHGTNLSTENFGFVVGLNTTEIDLMVVAIKRMTDKEFKRRMERLKDARYHYTFPGALHQIAMFLSDPFGDSPQAGNLKCLEEHPLHWK